MNPLNPPSEVPSLVNANQITTPGNTECTEKQTTCFQNQRRPERHPATSKHVQPLRHWHGLKWSMPPVHSNTTLASRSVSKTMPGEDRRVEVVINELWELLNKQVYWLSSLPDNAKADFRQFIHSNFHQSDIINANQQELVNRLKSEMMMFSPGSESEKGKHTAKRPQEEWDNVLNYGDTSVWDKEFEQTVKECLRKMQQTDFKAEKMVDFCSERRRKMAKKQGSCKWQDFGKKHKLYIVTFLSGPAYRYAISRAVKTEPNDQDYIEIFDKNDLKAREIRGVIDGKAVALTRLELWRCPLKENHRFRLAHMKSYKPACTEYTNEHFAKIGDTFYCPVWVSPDGEETIPTVMPYIYKLIEKAIAGDLSQIPKIHWWYVQLAPVVRGPGGIAEMITNAICRLHRIDLPSWKEGVAPSVEVLLEPSEERFCQNYHRLFSAGQDQFEKIFEPQRPTAPEIPGE